MKKKRDVKEVGDGKLHGEESHGVEPHGTELRSAERFEKELSGNRQYKDTVFRMLFRDKKELLSLYNAMNGSHYTDPEQLEIVTLENAVYMSMKNDLAFLADFHLYLYEHQSTVNPNIPLRFLQYVAKEYEKLIAGELVYGRKRLMLPEPRFAVFYNGTEPLPERMELRLSESFAGYVGGKQAKKGSTRAKKREVLLEEAFEASPAEAADPQLERVNPQLEQVNPQLEQVNPQLEQADPQLELRVQVWNINAGHNDPLKEQCRTLKEYMLYVDCVRKKAETMPVKDAVPLAVDQCIREGILADFLRKNKAEVVPLSIYEYNEEAVMTVIREEAREEGREEGQEKGRKEGIELVRRLLEDGRQEEIGRVMEDDAYLGKLLSEYGL